MSFFFAKEYDRALRHFNHALRLDPKNDKAEFMNGVVEIWVGHFEEAKLHFANALKLQPHNAHYPLHNGVLLAMLNENAQALASMLEAERLDHSNPHQIGKRYQKMGSFQRLAGSWKPASACGQPRLPLCINWERRTEETKAR